MPGIWLGPNGGAGGVISAGTLTYALATSPTRVLAKFTTQPLRGGGAAPGDAQDPQRWAITPDFPVPPGDPGWPVVAVLEAEPFDPTAVLLATLRPLQPSEELSVAAFWPTFTLTGFGIRTQTGAINFGLTKQFNGVVLQRSSRDPAPAAFGTDVANTQAVGGLSVGPDGDFAREGGNSLLKKLIIRRVVTSRGAFRHLPDYGALPVLKGLVRQIDLDQLASQLRRDVLDVPAVVASSVSVEQQGGAVIVQVRVKTASGLSAEVVVPIKVEA